VTAGPAEPADALDAAVEILFAARSRARPIGDLPEGLRPRDLDECYRLQDRLNLRLAASGLGEPVGYKIGCTTSVMQSYLGIAHPCAGRMFASSVRRSGAVFRREALCRPGVECEIAVRLRRDMGPGRVYSAGDCADHVEAAMAAIELVDDRWSDFGKVSTPTLIAENFFNAGCVLGEPARVSGDDLRRTVGSMRINGEIVGTGSGGDILGHPFEALAWLANDRIRRGAPLRAGEIVSLGSVVRTAWIEAGDEVEIDFDLLGGCALRLA
jgi:2-keto-4-pentenoate hydratase